MHLKAVRKYNKKYICVLSKSWNRMCDENQGCGRRSHETNRNVQEYCVCGIPHMPKICICQQNIKTCKQEYESANKHCLRDKIFVDEIKIHKKLFN